MTAEQCSYCARLRAIGARRIALHLHRSVLEGFVITDFWSDGTRTQRVAWTGARIEGPVF